MANCIRTSRWATGAIPEEHAYLMHSMYEDSDLDGANAAEATFDFIEREAPGRFVLILANDSVTPPCCQRDGHFECDYYDPYWHYILVRSATWEAYKERVEAKHQEWVAQRGCKLAK